MNETLKIPTMRTIRETAEFFNLPEHFVRSKVNSGEVVAVRAGRKYLVNIERFADYLNGCTLAKAAPRRSADDTAPRVMSIALNRGGDCN